MSLDDTLDNIHVLNDHEKDFLCDWGIKSVKFSLGDTIPCITIWNSCLVIAGGRIKMGKKDTPDQYDIIKIDDSDGKIIISVKNGSSFNYFAELVS